MTVHTFREIGATARRIHYNHGRGDVRETRVFADGRIEIDVWIPSAQRCGRFQTYTGRLCNRGRSVRLHGRQARITFMHAEGCEP